jgi:hypothetical protein
MQVMMGPLPLAGAVVGIQAVPVAIGVVITTVVVLSMMGIFVGSFLGERRLSGEPSVLSRLAVWAGKRSGLPLWAALPYAVMAAGLGLALLGWRVWSVGGPDVIGVDLAVVGLSITVLGGILSTALAHPPKLAQDVPGDIARPVPAHRWRPRFGTGPVGAVLVLVGGLTAVLATPVVAVWRVVSGSPPETTFIAHSVVLAGVGLATVGVWSVHVEGARAARREGLESTASWVGRAMEVLSGAIILLGLSVALDSAAPVELIGILGLIALLTVRIRSAGGTALASVGAYLTLRGLASVLTLQFAGTVIPLWWQSIVAAVVVEIVVAALVLLSSLLLRRPVRGGKS